MTQGEKTLVLIHHLHSRAVELSHKLLFVEENSRHLHVMALYGSTLELVSNMILLTKDGPKTAVPIVLRSVLEAFVDLFNLCADAKYGYSLDARAEKDRLKLLKEALGGKNQYLAMVSEAPDLKERIAHHEARLKTMKENGAEDLKIKEKFERAGLIKEYMTVYADLCSHSHNTLQALRDRHFKKNQDGHEVVYYRFTSLDEIEHLFGIACTVLLRATEQVHGFFNNPCPDEISKMKNEFDAFVAAHEAA
jgi:hypothetical protein